MEVLSRVFDSVFDSVAKHRGDEFSQIQRSPLSVFPRTFEDGQMFYGLTLIMG